MSLSDTARSKLASVSTATLTTVLFKRGYRNLFMQGVRRVTDHPANLVAPAFTLRYIPAREDLDGLEAFKDLEHPQRKAVETIPPGHALVMDCRRDSTAASAGDILLARMQIRGAAGVITDGGLRDMTDIAMMDWPVFAAGASAPTNLIKHHAVDLNVPIACGDVPVYPGDILVGDGDGVVVIPSGIAESVANEASDQHVFEEFVHEEVVSQQKSIFGIYPPNADTLARFEAWKRERG